MIYNVITESEREEKTKQERTETDVTRFEKFPKKNAFLGQGSLPRSPTSAPAMGVEQKLVKANRDPPRAAKSNP